MKRLKEFFRQPGLHALLFGFGFLFFNWPLLGLIHLKLLNSVFIYLFSQWAVAILFLFLISVSCRGKDH